MAPVAMPEFATLCGKVNTAHASFGLLVPRMITAKPETDHGTRAYRPEGTLVGRTRELTQFQSAFERMLAGQRETLLIYGEPGIGKTCCAEAFAQLAEDQGSLVLWGRCYEDAGAPPYWPWIQILREFIASSSPSELQGTIGAQREDIAAIVPELGNGSANEDSRAIGDAPDHVRFRTFDAICQLLINAARQVPLIIILDNIHWADSTSMALLAFLSHEVFRSRILLVCTYRESELSNRGPLPETLGELQRAGNLDRLSLAGLDRTEIQTIATQILQDQVVEAIIDAIYEQTDGNPLFVIEIVKVLQEEYRTTGAGPFAVRIPDGVRATISHRLKKLSQEEHGFLVSASVLGRSFSLQELAAFCKIGIDRVVANLEPLQRTGIIEALSSSPNAFRFTHVLIRETVYDAIPYQERMRLHAMAGDVLIATHEGTRLDLLAPVANHYCKALPAGDVDKAIDYSFFAAEAAMKVGAYEDVLLHLDQLMAALEPLQLGADPRIRKMIPLKAQALCQVGDTVRATAVITDAFDRIDSACDASWIADVATRLVIVTSESPQLKALPLLQTALQLLPREDSKERARALAALAYARRSVDEGSLIPGLVSQSLAMARRIGNPTLLCDCLGLAIQAQRGNPTTLDERLKYGYELVETSSKALNTSSGFEGYYWQTQNLLEAGNIEQFEYLLDRMAGQKAATWGLLRYRTAAFRIILRLLRGQFGGVEEDIESLLQIGMRTSRPGDAEGVYGAQMFALNRDLGRLPSLKPLVCRFRDLPGTRKWVPGMMLAFTEIGMLQDARLEFEKLASDNFSKISNDDMRLTCLVYCAETCCALGDADRAATLYQLLIPYEGSLASHPTAVCHGATDLYLAMLAAAMDKPELAQFHFNAALEKNRLMGARPWHARTLFRYAGFLQMRPDPNDQEHASRMFGEAEQIAAELGMTGLVAEINVCRSASEARKSYPDGLTAREVDVLRLLAIGRSNKDVAKVLSISLNTVATHVRNILNRTHCANRTEVAVYAFRHNLMDSNEEFQINQQE
jgi:DNA-binding CsgD family transcriptional regulator